MTPEPVALQITKTKTIKNMIFSTGNLPKFAFISAS